tara:strand:- start:3253 stop:3699 length:447 start_codon:yes stop_codon:yes gene_type:complete
MVSIYIGYEDNYGKSFIAPIFHFDDNDKLIIPPNTERGYNRSTFSYLARHVKTKVADFKKYIEDQYLNEKSGFHEYKVVTETLYNDLDIKVGQSVILLENGDCIEETKVPRDVENITSYGIVEHESIFKNINYADECFYNESKLIKNM